MGAKAIYPWDKWFERKTRLTLRKGVDYHCQSHGMAQQFRKQSEKRGVPVSITITDQGLEVVKVA